MARVSEVGEFGLIQRIKSRKAAHDQDVVLGIGDDAAILRRGSLLEVLTTDCLVEGTHYEDGWLDMQDVGWKALAVNVSDIAAMGGIPKHALVTLFLPDDFTTGELDAVYDGIEECGREMGATVVGGDIVKIKGPFAISVTLSGICERDDLALRSGAVKDDIIVVTGSLGGASVGLKCLREGLFPTKGSSLEECIKRFKRPLPRFKESRVIIQDLQPSAMIDISDGLLSDIWHILEASNVGAILEADRIPIARCVLDFFEENQEKALSQVLNGGEDYELLFTTNARHEPKLSEISARAGVGLTKIGKIAPKGTGVKLKSVKGEKELQRGGFDHFKPGAFYAKGDLKLQIRESYVRRMTKMVYVGEVPVGGGAPIVVESMTKTNTVDVRSTVNQIKNLEKAGCDMVRVAVPDYEAAEALSTIKEKSKIPVIADIHFNYKLALMALEAGIDCVRINPGNIGGRENIIRTAEAARRHKVPLRVGVNAGSLEKPLLQKYGAPIPEALVESIARTVSLLEDIGFADIVISAKAARVPVMIETYRMIANRFRYPLHVGVTEAGLPPAGAIRSAIGIGTLLAEGIGDTIRVSLTAPPVEEIKVGQEILKSLFLKEVGPMIISCPTCGRCEVDLTKIVKRVEKRIAGIKQPTIVAIMGCAVNGPGEARDADVGIAAAKGSVLIFRKGEIIKKVAPSKAVTTLLREMKQVVKRRGKPRRR